MLFKEKVEVDNNNNINSLKNNNDILKIGLHARNLKYLPNLGAFLAYQVQSGLIVLVECTLQNPHLISKIELLGLV